MNKCRRNAARKRREKVRRYFAAWRRITVLSWDISEIRAASCMVTVEQ